MSNPIDWRHNADSGNWKATIGQWRATVLHMTRMNNWYPYLRGMSPPHDRQDGPHFASASEARDWCEAEIARLEAQG
jgi:hypothetical protein